MAELEEGEYLENENNEEEDSGTQPSCSAGGLIALANGIQTQLAATAANHDHNATATLDINIVRNTHLELAATTSVEQQEEGEEDDDDLLRQQLLTQVRLKKAAKVSGPSRERETARGTAAVNGQSERQRDFYQEMGVLRRKLVNVQRKRTTIIRQRRKLEQSMEQCDNSLESNEKEMDELIASVHSLINQRVKIKSARPPLSEPRAQDRDQRIARRDEDTAPKTRKWAKEFASGSSLKVKIMQTNEPGSKRRRVEHSELVEEVQMKTRDGMEQEQQGERQKITEEPAASNTEEMTVTQHHEVTESIITEKIDQGKEKSRPELSHAGENRSTLESLNEQVVSLESAQIEANGTLANGHEEELEEGQIVDDQVEASEQQQERANEAEKEREQMVEITEGMARMGECQGEQQRPEQIDTVQQATGEGEEEPTIDDIDPFFASIRSYRLSHHFPHKLIGHLALSNRLDPFIPLCPFQLHGRCADRTCPWQHDYEYQLSELDIVKDLIEFFPQLCPRAKKPEEYATKLLAEGPLEQVVGYLVSKLPDEARYNYFANADRRMSLHSFRSNKPVPADERVEYEPTVPSSLRLTGIATS